MIPHYQLLVDGLDITGLVGTRLQSIRVVDEAGLKSDTLEIQLDDGRGLIELPARGVSLAVALGYLGTGLVSLGTYVVDELELEGPPQTLKIRARGADLRAGIKAPKSRSFDDVTLGDLTTTIALDHGYIARVASSLTGVWLGHVDQTEESDLHLLTRLCEDIGALAKPTGEYLCVVERGAATSASGEPTPELAITPADVSRWSVTLQDRSSYESVIARWRDLDGASEVKVTAGSGSPTYTLRQMYDSDAAARSAAEAKLKALARGTGTLRFTCVGRPELMAEGRVNLSGFRSGVDGAWGITRVTHTLDRGGYRCDVEGDTV